MEVTDYDHGRPYVEADALAAYQQLKDRLGSKFTPQLFFTTYN